MKKVVALVLLLSLLLSMSALAAYTGPAKIRKGIDRAAVCDADGNQIGNLKPGAKIDIIGWKKMPHGGSYAHFEYKGKTGYVWKYNLEGEDTPVLYNVYHDEIISRKTW